MSLKEAQSLFRKIVRKDGLIRWNEGLTVYSPTIKHKQMQTKVKYKLKLEPKYYIQEQNGYLFHKSGSKDYYYCDRDYFNKLEESF